MKGMRLAISYFFAARKERPKEWITDENYYKKAEGIFTVQYPKESIPIPDNGRYQLHNEIDDCIVCDKCAKICPVDCIDIEPVRASEVFGQTSDGTPMRIHAAKFDIDMAKCCFCGLCTVVCPTECLTMTTEFDFSTTDILDHNFSFSKMSAQEISEKKQEFEDYQAQKARDRAPLPDSKPADPKPGKPIFKPKMPGAAGMKEGSSPKKPVVKPRIKPMPDTDPPAKAKKPVIKPKVPGASTSNASEAPSPKKGAKPVIKPKMPKRK